MSAPRICADCGAEVWGFYSYEQGWVCDDCRNKRYVSLCMVTEITPELRRSLPILEDGTVELNPRSLALLYAAVTLGAGMFGYAETGVAEWALEAGADPSIWEEEFAS